MDEVTIKKLLNSTNEDDVILGVEFLYKECERDRQKIDNILENCIFKVTLDIYIGDINIVIWGHRDMQYSIYTSSNVYEISHKRVVRL